MTRHGNQVEWALHCVSMLAGLEGGQRLPASALAELFEVPPQYLSKALQSLASAGLLTSTTGPKGGYALGRAPSDISLLDIVDAVEGREPLFRCQEIRRRGPCRVVGEKHFSKPCQLAAAMWRAETAWRHELASVTIADIARDVEKTVSPRIIGVLQSWAAEKLD